MPTGFWLETTQGVPRSPYQLMTVETKFNGPCWESVKDSSSPRDRCPPAFRYFHLRLSYFSCNPMASRMVLVDDMDSGIQYVGPWFESHGSQDKSGTFGLPIRSTLHGVTQNAGLSYAFSGSYVALQGTCDVEKVDGVLNPSWECFVDGVSIGYKEPHFFLEDRCTLCETEHLDDRPHVITVNTTVRNNKIFWFDDVSYIPSASVALDQALVYIESSDSSIQYGAGWRGVRDIAYMTSEAGSKLTFEFTGASISWYGFIPNDMPLASTSATYSIDGETPVRFLLNGLLPATQDRYNQLFFQSPNYHLAIIHLWLSMKATPRRLPLFLTTSSCKTGPQVAPPLVELRTVFLHPLRGQIHLGHQGKLP
ncbi:hypothetical protein B0H34DRAFT_132315 [Crassisporium funariophilum]|nr:hypothetical protein B0H34DRAFT_132315 [Crassisporium funariophilum]